jgi:branched-subunit amino acid ABC-type transport system permease component
VLIFLADREGGKNGGGTIRISNNILDDLVNGNLSVAAGWILLIVEVVAFAVFSLLRDRQRRANGLVVPPTALTILRIVAVAAAGVALVAICNTNRGRLASHPVQGVPWVVLIVLGTYIIWTALLGRTRFGRYIYAIGGNAEAARRAGINLRRVRQAAFTLTGLTAGIAGIVLASQLGSISSDVDGGQLVLYAVAAAVIGGTSLFGGSGKMLHAVVGGLVIATIAKWHGPHRAQRRRPVHGHRPGAARRGHGGRPGPPGCQPSLNWASRLPATLVARGVPPLRRRASRAAPASVSSAAGCGSRGASSYAATPTRWCRAAWR